MADLVDLHDKEALANKKTERFIIITSMLAAVYEVGWNQSYILV